MHAEKRQSSLPVSEMHLHAQPEARGVSFKDVHANVHRNETTRPAQSVLWADPLLCSCIAHEHNNNLAEQSSAELVEVLLVANSSWEYNYY